MKTVLVFVLGVSVAGCGLTHKTVEEKPVGSYKTVHHTITFDTEPLCVGSCLVEAGQ